MIGGALQKRYGRTAKLTAGKRVQFTDDAGDTFTGTIVEALDSEGQRVLRVELDPDPDEPDAEAGVVEVPAAVCTSCRAKAVKAS